jgi:hypothetical protein
MAVMRELILRAIENAWTRIDVSARREKLRLDSHEAGATESSAMLC